MKFYVLDSSTVDRLTEDVADTDNPDLAVRRAASRWHHDDRLDYAFDGYTGIVAFHDLDADEWAENELAQALSEACAGQCTWFGFSAADALSARRHLAAITLTDEEIVPYFDALKWDGDPAADIRTLHRFLIDALSSVSRGQIGLLRVED